MAIAAVGSLGAVTTAATNSVTPAYGQTPTAGNTLVAWVSAVNTAGTTGAISTATSGWTRIQHTEGTNAGVAVFVKNPAVGGDATPTFTCTTATLFAAMLGEFSGVVPDTNPVWRSATSTTTTSPKTLTLNTADQIVGDLVLGVQASLMASAGTITNSDTMNNGATATGNANNGATSGQSHYDFAAYGIPTGNASAQNCAFTFTSSGPAYTDAAFLLVSLRAKTAFGPMVPSTVRPPGAGPLAFYSHPGRVGRMVQAQQADPLIENLTTADTLATAQVLGRTDSETLTTSDSVTRAAVEARTDTDTLTTADTVSRAQVLARAISETLATADSIARAQVLARSLSETLTTVDSLVRAATLFRATSDSLTTADSAARALAAARALSESLTTTASLVRAQVLARAITDTLSFSDAAIRAAVMGRSVVETLTTADSVSAVLGFVRNITETDLTAEGGNLSNVITATAGVLEPRIYFSTAAPTGAGLTEGGCLISYQGTPLETAGDFSTVNYNGNGYSYTQMTPTTPPTAVGHSAAPATLSTAITAGQVFTGATLHVVGSITVLKNQLIQLDDGAGHTWRVAAKAAVTAGSSFVPVSASTQAISTATTGQKNVVLTNPPPPSLEVGATVALTGGTAESGVVTAISGSTVTLQNNIVNSGHTTLNWGSVSPFAFSASGSVTVKMVWDIAVLETFRGQQDSPDPSEGPGSTPIFQVADTGGSPLNITVTYTPSCPQGIGDWTSTPTYKLLIRPSTKDLTQVDSNNFYLYATTSVAGNPSWTINTAYDAGGTQYSNSQGGYNNPPHDQFVDVRMLRMWQQLVQLGIGAYQTDYDTLKDKVSLEFDNDGGGLRPWHARLMLQLADGDPLYASPVNGAGTGTGGKTWEGIALQYLRDLYAKNYNALTVNNVSYSGLGMYVDPTATPNPSPATYGAGTTLKVGLTSGTAYTTLTLNAAIGTAISSSGAVLLSEAGHTQVFYLANAALSTDTSLTVHSQAASFSFTTAATVKPCNAPMGQARFEYTCEAAALLYEGWQRAWSAGGVTTAEQANWKAAADSITSAISTLGNLVTTSFNLPQQQTYIDADQNGNPVYTGVLLSGAVSCKPADVGDGVYHLLVAYVYSANSSALTVAKKIINALYGAGPGGATSPVAVYDATNHGFWSQVNSDGTNVQSSYKESGRLAYWLGVFRLLNRIIEPGLWSTQYLDWQNFVNVRSWQSGKGWVYRTNGDYTTYSTTSTSGGATVPYTVNETWCTTEAAGIAMLQLLDDSVGSIVRQQVLGRAETETLTTSDALARAIAAGRTPTEILTTADQAARQATMVRTDTDTLATTDSAARQEAAGRSDTETLSTSDAAARATAAQRSEAETLTTADAAARAEAAARSDAETLTTADAAARATAAGRTDTESLTTSDAAARAEAAGRSETENLSTGDVVGHQMGFVRVIADTLTTADAVSWASTLARTAADTLTTADAVARSAALGRGDAETLTTADTVSRVGAYARSIADNLSTLDSVTRTETAARATADTLATVDSAARAEALARSLSETLTTSDEVTRAFNGVVVILDDALTTVDALTRFVAASRGMADTLTTTDSVARQSALGRGPAESLPESDATTRQTQAGRSPAETLSTADAAARQEVLSRSDAENLATTDAAARQEALGRGETESLTTADAAARQEQAGRAEIETLTTADAVARRAGFVRNLQETFAALSDGVVIAKTGFLSIQPLQDFPVTKILGVPPRPATPQMQPVADLAVTTIGGADSQGAE